jgi:hypothetical protein
VVSSSAVEMYKKNTREQMDACIYRDGVKGAWLHGKFKVGYAFTYQTVSGLHLHMRALEGRTLR